MRIFAYLFGLTALTAIAVWTFTFSSHFYDASSVVTPCITAPSGVEHWGTPGCKGESRVSELKAELSFNSAGLRDREYPSQPPRGVFRILLMGSSNTLGPGIEESKTLPRQLEQSLRSLGKKVEVINAGMVGYCTIQSSLKLKELLDLYSPNLVLFQFVQGTCPLFDGAWADRVVLENGNPARIDRSPFGAGTLQSFNNFAFAHPSFFFFWLTAADQLRKASFSWKYSSGSDVPARVSLYLEPTVTFLGHMKRLAASKGAELAVLSYQMRPFSQSVPSHFHQWLARLLAHLVKPIDFGSDEMFAHLTAKGFRVIYHPENTKPFLIPGDVHQSPEGLAVMASKTAAKLAPEIR